jgi:hypothetical protein
MPSDDSSNRVNASATQLAPPADSEFSVSCSAASTGQGRHVQSSRLLQSESALHVSFVVALPGARHAKKMLSQNIYILYLSLYIYI